MKKISIIPLLLALCMALTACSINVSTAGTLAATTQTTVNSDEIINAAQPYSSEAYTELNGNVPTFAQSEITTDSFEEYGKLDDLGRCTTCVACVGKDLMPTEKRGADGAGNDDIQHSQSRACRKGYGKTRRNGGKTRL